LRSVGIVKKFSNDPHQNDFEFKCAVRWVICGEVEDQTTHVFTKAQPDDWPGMAFNGGLPYVVLDALLREYAPKRWPDHKGTFQSMELMELFAPEAISREAINPFPHDIERAHCKVIDPFLQGIEGALLGDHQEPCLILDAQCLPRDGVPWWQCSPAPPFEVNHANCISDISVPICGEGERCVCLKDSNFDNVREVCTAMPGLLSKFGHHRGSGPSIIWIRPNQDLIKIVTPSSVSFSECNLFPQFHFF
jgi:hypothetical protein